jgi:hypothetical protein
MHMGFKCLNVTGGRIYISRDVFFDEIVYPFSKLNPNAGARLRSTILLLPPQIQPHNLPTHGADLSEDRSSHAHIIPVSTDVVCSPVSTEKNPVSICAGNQQENAIQANTGLGVASV